MIDSDQNFSISKVIELNGSKEQIYSAIMSYLNLDECNNIHSDKDAGIIKYDDLEWIGMIHSTIELLWVKRYVKIQIKDNKYKITYTITNICPDKKLSYRLYKVYPNVDYNDVTIKYSTKYGSKTKEIVTEINKELHESLNRLVISSLNTFIKHIKIEDDF